MSRHGTVIEIASERNQTSVTFPMELSVDESVSKKTCVTLISSFAEDVKLISVADAAEAFET